MSSYSATAVSPFTQAVVDSMRKLYPESLADKSFDNTGILLEAPFDLQRRRLNSILLTIDLTRAVADEAIHNNHSVIVAYHPIIFRALKSLTLSNTQQSSLLRLAAHGVSVYCPHTAVDAAPDGMADWLCDIVTGKLSNPELETPAPSLKPIPGQVSDSNPSPEKPLRKTSFKETDSFTSSTPPVPKTPLSSSAQPSRPARRPSLFQRTYSQPSYPQLTSVSVPAQPPSSIPHTRSVIHPCESSALNAANTLTESSKYTVSNTGMGRLIRLENPQPLPLLIERIAVGVGHPAGFPVAIPQSAGVEDIMISRIGVCPGSGGSVLGNCEAAGEGGLLFTGELAHHEALAVVEKGGCVVALGHSNSERGYLGARMRDKVLDEVTKEWARVRKLMEEGKYGGTEGGKRLKEMWRDGDVGVDISARDRDPFGIVILQPSG